MHRSMCNVIGENSEHYEQLLKPQANTNGARTNKDRKTTEEHSPTHCEDTGVH